MREYMKKTRWSVVGGLVVAATGLAYGQAMQTYTGTVSDAMCGAKHTMGENDPAKCTRECVKEGSKYALVVGTKVYTLQGETAGLDKYAGGKATVSGTKSGDMITVKAVGVAKP